MANSNCGCGSNSADQGRGGFRGVVPFLLRVKNQHNTNGQNCDNGIFLTPEIEFLPHEMCDPCPSNQGTSVPKWVWALLGGLLGLMLLGFLLWLAMSRPVGVASAMMAPATLAQAGQPVSVTANPVNYTEINLNGAQLSSTGVKPSAKPVNPAVPTAPCKAVVFDPSGSMNRFGVTLAVDGGNYIIDQINGGRLASPNEIQAAQAAKKEWIMVVYDAQAPYAINHKGNIVPVTMDASGRILVSAAQVSI